MKNVFGDLARQGETNVLRFFASQGAVVAFLLLFVSASLLYDQFFTYTNLSNIIRQVSMVGLVAVGMTFVILVGGIDLSVGSVVALAGVLAAMLSGTNVWLAVFLPIAAGALIGFVNGAVVAKLKVVPFIATLASMMGVRGIAYIATNEQSVTVDTASGFTNLARAYVLGIPLPALIFLAAVGAAAFIAKYTGLGRHLFAVGGNEEASRMMGLHADRVKIAAYSISGMLAGFAGVILASRLGAGQSVAAEGWEMTAIAAVVIGGTLLSGGVGKFSGTLVGVLVIGVITNMFNMQGNINTWWQNVMMGALLLLVVVIQSQVQSKREGRS